jgi:putative transposase
MAFGIWVPTVSPEVDRRRKSDRPGLQSRHHGVTQHLRASAPAICFPSSVPETYALTAVAHHGTGCSTSADLLIATLFRYREQRRFLLHGFVIMPEHIHVLLTPAETVERAAQLIKAGYSFAMRKRRPGEVWHPGYHARRITSAEDYRNQLAYIANNPKKRESQRYVIFHAMLCAPKIPRSFHRKLIPKWDGISAKCNCRNAFRKLTLDGPRAGPSLWRETRVPHDAQNPGRRSLCRDGRRSICDDQAVRLERVEKEPLNRQPRRARSRNAWYMNDPRYQPSRYL